MEQIVETWRRLEPRRRIILAGAVALTIVAVLALAQVATRPGMALLYSGLDPAAAGEVVGALEQMGVESEVRGDAIYVPGDTRDRVRLALAREGLPRQGHAGYELLDKLSGFSTTTEMFNAAYWRAKEGELARTIVASPGVRDARVHIAPPERRPFARGGDGASASVTVTMAGGALGRKQATAFRYLVALAVAELGPEQVAVIDSGAGVVLAPGTDAPAATAESEAAAREAKLKAELEELLAARVGRDKARVNVTVEVERAAETVTERRIEPESRVTIHSDTEEIRDSSSGSAGAVTVASNLPDGDAGEGEQRSSARTETRERANYEYSEVERRTVREPGAVRRLSVAVLVDGITTTGPDGEPVREPRPAAELEALRELVKAAVGYDQGRGDTVTVESMAFQADATPGTLAESPSWRDALARNALTLVQLGVLALVVLVLALRVVRPLLMGPRGGPGATDVYAHAREIEATASGTGLLPGQGGEEAGVDEAGASGPQPDTERLRRVVAERPEQAVSTLRHWLAADEKEPA